MPDNHAHNCTAFQLTYFGAMQAIEPKPGDDAMCILSGVLAAAASFAAAVAQPEQREAVKAALQQIVGKYFDVEVRALDAAGETPWRLMDAPTVTLN